MLKKSIRCSIYQGSYLLTWCQMIILMTMVNLETKESKQGQTWPDCTYLTSYLFRLNYRLIEQDSQEFQSNSPSANLQRTFPNIFQEEEIILIPLREAKPNGYITGWFTCIWGSLPSCPRLKKVLLRTWTILFCLIFLCSYKLKKKKSEWGPGTKLLQEHWVEKQIKGHI